MKHGFIYTTPIIQSVNFKERGRMNVVLKDGRVLSVPLSAFPPIKKLSVAQRKKFSIVNDAAVLFHEADEVYHLQDFLGVPENYVYKG